MPRRALGSELNLETLLAALLPRYEGYALNQILLRLYALIAMYLLLGALLPRARDPDGRIRVGAAACFATTVTKIPRVTASTATVTNEQFSPAVCAPK